MPLTVTHGPLAQFDNTFAVTPCRSQALLVVNVSCAHGALQGISIGITATGAYGTVVAVTEDSGGDGAAAFRFDMTAEALASWSLEIDGYEWSYPYGPPRLSIGQLTAAHVSIDDYPCEWKLFAAVWSINTEKAANGDLRTPGLANRTPQQRLQLLTAALTRAEAEAEALGDRTHTICVFAAPEYYFVGGTNAGHFLTRAEKQLLVQQFNAAAAAFPHFLVFGGTVGWYETIAEAPGTFIADYKNNLAAAGGLPHHATAQRETLGDFMDEVLERFSDRFVQNDVAVRIVHNTALISAGGTPSVYDKRFESIDNNDLSQDIPGFNNFPYDDCIFSPGRHSPLVDFNGLTFGLEICADHESASLLDASAGAAPDVHVICSATVSPTEQHVACRDGGYLIQADSRSAMVCTKDLEPRDALQTIDTNPGSLSIYQLELE